MAPMSSQGSPRFIQWVAFLLFSTITLFSTVEMVNNLHSGTPRTASERWALATSSITFILTLVTVGMHMHPISAVHIKGTQIEGGICLALVVFWIISVSIITNPRYELAVTNEGAVSNGNLYYASWAGFISSVTIAVSYLQTAFEIDVVGEIRTRAARLNYWACLLSTSIVVMGCSVNTLMVFCNGEEGVDMGTLYCNRTKYGISLGTVATLASLLVIVSKIHFQIAPFLVEAAIGVVLTITYLFGVAYITSQEGPGAPLGNLYYFTWISFLDGCMISASCFEDYQASKAASMNTTNDLDAETGDIEELDDNL